MSLINRKVELKCKWMSHCILSAVGTYNDDVHPNNNILAIKDTQRYVPVVTLSAQENQKLKKKKLLSKRFERSLYWNDCKTKSESKHSRNEYIHNFSNQNLSVLVDCLD